MPEDKTTKSAEKAEKKTTAAKKTAAKTEGTPAKKTAARKSAAKTSGRRGSAKKAITLDDLTALIWNKLENKDVISIPFPIAIQVNVRDVGTFYIAVNDNPDHPKQVEPYDYYNADGTVETTADDIKKIAAGDYDYIAAAKSGAFTYRGDLTKGALIAELIK